MPLIECTLIKGYDSNTRRIIAERITDAACSAIGAAPEFVTVTINEVAADNYMRGRTGRTPATALAAEKNNEPKRIRSRKK